MGREDMVKQILAIILSLVMALVLGCAQVTPSPTPSPRPTPKAAPPPAPTSTVAPSPTPTRVPPSVTPRESPTPTPPAEDILRQLAWRLPEIRDVAANVVGKQRFEATSSTNLTDVHFPTVAIGSRLWRFKWPADKFIKAVEYIDAANSLATTGKLAYETRPRDVSPEVMITQILTVCQQAADQLDAQIKISYSWQEGFCKWIRENQFEVTRYPTQPTTEQRQRAVIEINQYFDGYRKDLSDIKAKIAVALAFGKYLRKQQA